MLQFTVLPLLRLYTFQLSWADLKVTNFLEWQVTGADELDKYPKIKALVERVKSNAGLAKWLKERPVTEM